MRNVVAWLGVLGLAAAACGGESHGHPAATSGSPGSSGSAGKPSTGSSGGNASTGGVAIAGANAGGTESGDDASAGAAGQRETAGASGSGDGGSPALPDPNDILKVKPSAGCGKAATQATGVFVKFTIQTSGTKDANCADRLSGIPKCGVWSIPREYYVWLPPDYDKQHAYPLVLEAPGCSGSGALVYSLSPTNTAVGEGVNGSVIRVGLTPPPNSVGHATNENQGCFDDKEGDDSVDWPFYEALIDKLNPELCYDENRVFASGNSSGSSFSNELACKYAGNAAGYAVRGVAVHGGSLPTQPAYLPTCTDKPLAGIWIDELNEAADPFVTTNKVAIARAMQVNGCTSGTSYDTAQLTSFPIGAGQDPLVCKKIVGCPEQYPLVVCQVPSSHLTSERVVNPAFATFLQGLEAP